MRRLRRGSERGAILPLVGITLTVLIGFTSFAVDMGFLYIRKQAHVNADDAGALAGAQEFLEVKRATSDIGAAGVAAEVEGKKVALTNGLPDDGSGSQYVVARFNGSCKAKYPTYNCLDVTSQEQSPLFFAQIFGRSHSNVGARSTVVVGSPNVLPWEWVGRMGGLRPWGISQAQYTGDTGPIDPNNPVIATFKVGSPADGITSGNTFPVRLYMNKDATTVGSGANDYRWLVQNGSDHDYNLNQTTINSQPGSMGVNTGKEVYDLIKLDTIAGTTKKNDPYAAQFVKGCADLADFMNYALPKLGADNLRNVDEWVNPCARATLVPMVDWEKNGLDSPVVKGFGLIFILGTNWVPTPNVEAYQNTEFPYYKGPDALADAAGRAGWGTLTANNGDAVYGVFIRDLKLTSKSGTYIDPNSENSDFGIEMAVLVDQ